MGSGGGGWAGGQGFMKENLSGRLRVEPDQVKGHSGLKTD